MIVVFVVLGVAGVFFPPVWLAMAGYGIYAYASRHSRRDHAIESRVRSMVAAGKDFTIFRELHYEAARVYSVRKGSTSSDHSGAGATMIVDDHPYSVTFVPAAGPGGGTAIAIRDAAEIVQTFNSFAARAESYQVASYPAALK